MPALAEHCRGEVAAARASNRLLGLVEILEAAKPQRSGRPMLEQIERWQGTLQQLNADAREPDRIALAAPVRSPRGALAAPRGVGRRRLLRR